MNRFTKPQRFMLGCAALTVLLGVIAVGNMTYDDEVSYDEYRAQMEQLWEDTGGEYGWPRQQPPAQRADTGNQAPRQEASDDRLRP